MTRKLLIGLMFTVVTGPYISAQDAVIEKGKNDPTTGKPYALNNGGEKEIPEFVWQVSQARFNSDLVDICAQQYLEDVIFLSSRKGKATEDDWTTASSVDMYAFASDGDREEVVPFDSQLNSPGKEGPFTFNEDGDIMFFTRNLPAKKRQAKSTGKEETMIIMTCQLGRDGEWGFPKPFKHNSKHHGVGHPALSSDGMEMYFISDDPSGYGGYDLYVCYLDPQKGWSSPENMGPEINTSGDEMFPYAQDNGSLFFASNGHPGLGGFDVYKCAYENGQLTAPVGLDAPVNSSSDDFAISYREGNNSGYFSSNRVGGGGGTNVYSFTATLVEYPEASGIVMDGETDDPMRAQAVKLLNAEGKTVETTFTNAKGEFKFKLANDSPSFRVMIEADDYPDYTSADALAADGLDIDYGVITIANSLYSTSGMALDSKTGEAIAGMKAMLIDRATGEVITTASDINGGINFTLDANSQYDLKFEKEGYFAKTASFSTKEKPADNYDMNEYADLKFDKIVLDEGIRIDNIYFDYMSSYLNKKSMSSLSGLVDMLMDNPGINVEIGAHSDQRGKATFNQWLSERRAKSVAAYLVEGGIATERVTYKGYGETKPLRDCGGSCSDTDYEMNRRTEFKVLQP